MSPRRSAAAALVLVLSVACSGAKPAARPTPSGSESPTPSASPSPSPTPSPRKTPSPTPKATAASCSVGAQSPPRGTIAANFPTALAFAPDGRLFYAERSGTVRVWQNGRSRVFARVSTVTTEPGGAYSERGLLGLAISPTFTRDRYVYAFYSDSDRSHQRVIRWKDCGGKGTGARIIISLPAGSDCCHKGGRIAFGPDGMLYVTLGDEHVASSAQRKSDTRGKVLRFTPSGGIPSGNPFGNAVWAYGFRNPFGLAISRAGRIAITSNGPTGDAGSPSTGYDTVVDGVLKGGGYQWPYCYGYSHPLSGSCAGQHGPSWSSESSTVVPTGAWYVDSLGPSAERGHLVFCTYDVGMRILIPGSPHASVRSGPSGCRLAVTQAPDHALYYADTAHIYRLAA
ncbi:MAG: PQQ-dependent sugar dehydrogenase [Actinomycetota bacterium]